MLCCLSERSHTSYNTQSINSLYNKARISLHFPHPEYSLTTHTYPLRFLSLQLELLKYNRTHRVVTMMNNTNTFELYF